MSLPIYVYIILSRLKTDNLHRKIQYITNVARQNVLLTCKSRPEPGHWNITSKQIWIVFAYQLLVIVVLCVP